MVIQSTAAIQSAQTVSVLRAVAAAEKDPSFQSGDYLARYFLTGRYRWLLRLVPHRWLKKLIHFRSPGSYGFMVVRTRHFDQTLLRELKAGVQQVVILGAGYDTRPLRFADDLQGVAVYEVDFPGTQAYKLHKLNALCKGQLPATHFIPLDFNKADFGEALAAHGFTAQLKTLFLWEGVSYYLPEAVVKSVLSFAGRCARGSSILFDYAIRSFVEGDHSTYGGRQLAQWLQKINEPFLFGLAPGEAASFADSCGLSLVSDYGPEELERMYLGSDMLRGRTLGHVRMAHAMVSSHS